MPVEQQLLPSKKLQPLYDKVTWLFVSRNFKGDEKDREAERTHDRFGITSWPQLIVFDPRDDAVLGRLPRDLEHFKLQLASFGGVVPKPRTKDLLAAHRLADARALAKRGERRSALRILEQIDGTDDRVDAWLEARELLRVWRPRRRTLRERLEDPDIRERAIAIEEIARANPTARQHELIEPVAARLLDPGEHIIVRVRALHWLAQTAPDRVAARARRLLAIPSDPIRFGVLDVVRDHPDPQLAATLSRLFREAGGKVPSNNPNVLRSRIAHCMVESGDASTIEAVAELARAAQPDNGTTFAVLDALRGVASRASKEDRRRIVALLLESFPTGQDDPAQDDAQQKWLAPMIARLVPAVRKTLLAVSGVASLPPSPDPWRARDRARFLAAVRRKVAGRPR